MRNSLACTVAASVIAWAGFWTVLPSHAAEPNGLTKWEHLATDEKMVELYAKDWFFVPDEWRKLRTSPPSVTKGLLYLGLEGWELVAVVPKENTRFYYFKRPAGSGKGLPEVARMPDKL